MPSISRPLRVFLLYLSHLRRQEVVGEARVEADDPSQHQQGFHQLRSSFKLAQLQRDSLTGQIQQ